MVGARFAADTAAELAALAAALTADVVLLVEDPDDPGPGEALRAGLAAVPETTVVVARLGAPGAARVGAALAVVDGGAAGRAVLRMAAHLALRTPGDLAVEPLDGRRGARRVSAAVDALATRGVPARAAEPGETGVALTAVLPEGTDAPVDLGPAALLLRVRPSAADADEDLGQAIARISPGTPADAP
jgi:hypothetical protein